MNSQDKIEISVVIPVFRAEACLNELYKRLVSSLEALTDRFEIILIEDCGGDTSYEVISQFAARDPRVRGFQFSRNFGQHYGITAGLDLSRGRWVVVMDCDLQDQPEEIVKLYRKGVEEGFDIVLGQRQNRRDSLSHRLSSYLFYKVYNYLTGIQYDRGIAGFCMLSRKVVNSLCQMREKDRFFISLLHWVGFPTTKVPVTHAERFAGKSSFSFFQRLHLAWVVCLSYSTRPLHFSINLGAAIAGFSLIAALVTWILAIQGKIQVPGWASIVISLYFLAGLGMMNLGLVGVYIAKIFEQQKTRPLYIIRRTTDEAAAPA